jgi:hypothetical protein
MVELPILDTLGEGVVSAFHVSPQAKAIFVVDLRERA